MIIALATFGFANAQKGTVLVQGSIGFHTDKTTDAASEAKLSNFSVAPKVGYQFTDNWTVGGAVNFGVGKQTTTSNVPLYNYSEQKYNQIQAGAFVRYTKPLGEIFKVYADLDAGYVHTKHDGTNTNYDGFNFVSTTASYKVNGFYAAVTPAVFINVWKNFGLNFNVGGIGFGSTKDDTNLKTKRSAFDVNFGDTFSVGVSKNF